VPGQNPGWSSQGDSATVVVDDDDGREVAQEWNQDRLS